MCRSAAWPTSRDASTACSSIPEVTHTPQGARIYERFVREICGCANAWTAGNIIEDLIARVRAQVGAGTVLLGLSGGVDSSVVAALLHRAIGAQLTCVFVDHGLLRLRRGRRRSWTCSPEHLGVRVIRVNAARALLRRAAGRQPIRKPSARSSARCSSRSSTRRRAKLSDVAVSRAGHDLSRRDRVGRRETGKAHVIKIAITTSAACRPT